MFRSSSWESRSKYVDRNVVSDDVVEKIRCVPDNKYDWLNWYEESQYDLSYLRSKNPYPKMDDAISFEPLTHTYYLDGKKVKIPSVSTIVKEYSGCDSDFSMIAGFTAKGIRNKCIKWFDEIRSVCDESVDLQVRFLEGIDSFRKKHFGYRNLVHVLDISRVEQQLFNGIDESVEYINSITSAHVEECWGIGAQLGTDLHFYLECRLNKNEVRYPSIPFGVSEYDMAEDYLQDISELDVLRTEFRVYSERYSTIGTIDMMYCLERDEVTNEVLRAGLVDFKRSYKIKSEKDKDADYSRTKKQRMLPPFEDLSPSARNLYAFQLGMYAVIIEEELGIHIDKLHLVVFFEDNGGYLDVDLPYNRELIKEALDSR